MHQAITALIGLTALVASGCGGEIMSDVEEVIVLYRRVNPDFPVTAPSGSGPGWSLQLTELVLSETDNSPNTVSCRIDTPEASEVACRIGLKTIGGKALAQIVGEYTSESGRAPTTLIIPDGGFVQYGEFRGVLPAKARAPRSMNGHVANYAASWWTTLD